MNIAFRCDASLQIGTGHVMRCLTLADALCDRGAICHFISRPHEGHLIEMIRQRGHESTALPETIADFYPETDESLPPHAGWLGTKWSVDAGDTLNVIETQQVDWLIVDHYALDERWEKRLRPACKKLMVIDDLADRRHDCDLLLDQNLGHSEHDYEDLAPCASVKLYGPKYALLRPEFAELRPYSLARREQPLLKRILITMGGVDKDNVTGRVLEALTHLVLSPDLEVIVVMGPHAPWLEQVRRLAIDIPVTCRVLVNVDNIARLMADADLAIGAAGSTAWERCCLGLPTLLMVLADNQRKNAEILNTMGAVLLFENQENFDRELLEKITMASENLKALQDACRSVTDGKGVVRVIEMMMDENG